MGKYTNTLCLFQGIYCMNSKGSNLVQQSTIRGKCLLGCTNIYIYIICRWCSIMLKTEISVICITGKNPCLQKFYNDFPVIKSLLFKQCWIFKSGLCLVEKFCDSTRQIRMPVLRIPPAVTSQAKMKNWLHECQKWVSHMIGQYAHI